MKLLIDAEWCRRAAEHEGDSEIGACSPELAQQARKLATARGHKDVDADIVTVTGAKVPVWQFYIEQALFGASP
jgi:hypothetical protein